MINTKNSVIISLLMMLLLGLGTIFPGLIGRLNHSQQPDQTLLKRFYIDKLDDYYWLSRVDGISGLAHLLSGGQEEIPELVTHTETGSAFEQLVALWALARIKHPGNRELLRSRTSAETEKVGEGSFRELAARVAFLASYNRNRQMLQLLDRVLPDLYNAARSNDLEKQLLSAWALYEMDTPVTRETAGRALERASGALDPDHADYTRHLLFVRLTGSPAESFFSVKLSSIIKNHNFEGDLFSRKARTVRTLAELSYPKELRLLETFREQLADMLQHPLQDATALSHLITAGPFSCSESIRNILQKEMQKADDSKDRQELQKAMRICGS